MPRKGSSGRMTPFTDDTRKDSSRSVVDGAESKQSLLEPAAAAKLIEALKQQTKELEVKVHIRDREIYDLLYDPSDQVGDSPRHPAEDDEVVSGRILSCMNAWKSWARKHAAFGLEGLSETDRETLRAELRHCTSEPQACQMVKYSVENNQNRILVRVVLHGVLARYIVECIITNPFFCLPNFAISDRSPRNTLTDVPEYFQELYHQAVTGKSHFYVDRSNLTSGVEDENAANWWRSKTVSFVDSRSDTRDRNNQYYQHLAELFERKYASTLLNRCSPGAAQQRLHRLHEVIRQTGDLFFSLAKQRVRIEAWDYQELSKRGKICDPELVSMQEDPRLEAQDESKPGSYIRMVVTPAIVAFGDEQGCNYDKFKVWKKAVLSTTG